MTMTADPGIAAATWAIRPELPIDIDLVHELHRAAFPGSVEAELVDAIRSSPWYVPEGSLVAVTEDGSILGHVLISRVMLEHDGAPATEVLALAPLAVLPPHQGRGIGTALTRAALAAADVRDEPLTVVVGAPAFYARFGFEPARFFGIDGPWHDAGDAFQVRGRPGLEELPGGTVVYPPAFSAAGPD
jgi:predicted N-acetyltransferase YhbS